MPLYAISTEEGILSLETKSSLAQELTKYHCQKAGVPEDFVKIIFNAFASGDGFVGGKPTAPVILTLLIREGRSAEYKSDMVQCLWTMLQRATGARDEQMLVVIQEAPAIQAMELGKIVPPVKS